MRFRLSIALVLKHPVSICRSSRWYAGWLLVIAHPRVRARLLARSRAPSGPSCVLCGSFYSPLVDGRDDCHVGNLWSPQMPFEIRPIGWATVDTCHASFATFTSASYRLIICPIICRVAEMNRGANEIIRFRKLRLLLEKERNFIFD